MRGGHVAARVDLRPAGQVAHQLRDEELEAAALRALVPRRDRVVGVEGRVGHPRVHAAVDEGGDAEDAAAARVERAGHAVDARAVRLARVERRQVGLRHEDQVHERVVLEAGFGELRRLVEARALEAEDARPVVEAEELVDLFAREGNGRLRIELNVERAARHDADFELDIRLEPQDEVERRILLDAQLRQRRAITERPAAKD